MDLLLIRHAESLNNAQEHQPAAERQRQAEPPLTDVGHRQAAALAAAFAKGTYPRPDRLYSSPMMRAVMTAAPLSVALELPTVVHLEAFEAYGPVEFDHGDFNNARPHPGSSRSALFTANPHVVAPAQVTEQGWWPGPVEDEAAVMARVTRLLADLQERHGDSDEVVALVSHGTFGHHLIAHILQAETKTAFLMLANTSVSAITGLRRATVHRAGTTETPAQVVGEPFVGLPYIGRTSHLD